MVNTPRLSSWNCACMASSKINESWKHKTTVNPVHSWDQSMCPNNWSSLISGVIFEPAMKPVS